MDAQFRQQVFDAWSEAGQDVSAYDRDALMDASYDETDLALEADARIQSFPARCVPGGGYLPSPDYLPTYHTAALSTDNWRRSISARRDARLRGRRAAQGDPAGYACVKHQNMAGSDMGDDHKEYFSGDAALKAAGEDNTMNQFG